MSTRRARVKAVISLPPRRKNVDNNDAKSKLPTSNEGTRSPKTPQAKKAEETSQPSPTVVKKNETDKLALNEEKLTPLSTSHDFSTNLTIHKTNTPKSTNKIPVLTPKSTRHNFNMFASPVAKRDFPIMLAPSPLASKSYSSADLAQKVKTPIVAQENELSTKYSMSKEKIDDYNPPSVPDSLTEETVMDGIVPLNPTKTVPKPLDLLKNEIISENAEVVFDVIVPLPSPSKVRPKLRPVPRLMPFRRNSIQGSASESEDETRRALLSGGAHAQRSRHDSHTSHATLHSITNRELNRVRNDSVSSNISQAVTLPPIATSPVKEKHHLTKQRRNEMSRRLHSMRRRRETVKRDALTMYDLIFCNPMNNPMVPDQDELRAKEANLKDEEERKLAKVEEEALEEAEEPAPVPQIKLGPNGEIMLDEKSLVISGARALSAAGGAARAGAWAAGGRYTRAPRSADWSAAETVRFYRALAALGTDFSLMAPLFPTRNRRELKIKFKKEERLNCGLVDKALRSRITWDLDTLLADFEKEREEAKLREEQERDNLIMERKKLKERMRTANELSVRPSRGSKVLESSVVPQGKDYSADSKDLTADGLILQAIEAKKRRRKHTKKKEPESPTYNPYPSTVPATVTFSQKPVENTGLKDEEPASDTDKPDTADSLQSVLPTNIENGSLVVLTVNDPNSPSKKMLQTYISHGDGKLTPVALPPSLLNSVVGYMQKGTPKSVVSSGSSPQLMSPSSAASQENRTCTTPSVLNVNLSPNKRKRLSSYSITSL